MRFSTVKIIIKKRIKTMSKADMTGLKYFIVHMCVEIICFHLLRYYYPTELAGIIALTYDFFAFVPQGIIGDFIKKHNKVPYESIAHIFMFLSIFLVSSSFQAVHMIGYVFLATGNAILHECGAIATVADSEGKMFPAALFVAGGSFGLVIGQTFGIYQISLYVLIIPLLISWLLTLTTKKSVRAVNFPEFKSANLKKNPVTLLVAVFAVTAVRSYIAYAIPISWKKELWQTFLLFFIMGFGKGMGGFVSDRIGARKTALFSTLSAIPFLVAGENIMVLSIIGVCLFSMTMSITFEMSLNVLPKDPGLAFGVTTIGLFFGLLPAFFIQVSKMTNIMLVIVLSVLCFVILSKTLDKR